ncbi:hypothetical protein [Olleya aquimaris]|uniref:Uncharacterized protein n=1 Tax=Olleya aquimaris TaxID=639310 RepID=A0A327RH15_9FLAO|nr:hypothetical protein [Olleya aquimaris]RAJ16189.1 hypothetical protein LY08_01044 [Olleya aquimaris]
MKYYALILLISIFSFNTLKAQDYKKDSLQFKIITQIKYKSSQVESISLKKVLCDYCTEKQTEQLGLQALKLAALEQDNPNNIKNNGIKLLSIYIRLSKKDFKAIND